MAGLLCLRSRPHVALALRTYVTLIHAHARRPALPYLLAAIAGNRSTAIGIRFPRPLSTYRAESASELAAPAEERVRFCLRDTATGNRLFVRRARAGLL
jgi:hypothetical protein